MSERDWSYMYLLPLILVIGVVVGMPVMVIADYNTIAARDSLAADLGAIDAIIKSPAVIIKIDTLSAFKAKQVELQTEIYYSDWRLYLVPDSKLGYVYSPTFSFNPIGPPELTNP